MHALASQMPLPTSSRDLASAENEDLPALPPLSVQPARVGRVMAFVGAKGGCGTTFLASHVAAARALTERACLIDLNGANGDVAGLLDLECAHQLGDILDLEALDGPLLDSMATRHVTGLAVVPQPRDLADVVLLDPAGVARVIAAAKLEYDLVVLDCGSQLGEAALSAALVADAITVVMTPDISAVRSTHRRLKLFARFEADADTVHLVLNRGRRRSPLSRTQIEDHLHRAVAAEVREDVESCARCELEGHLLQQLPGHPRIAGDIFRLAAALLDDQEEAHAAPEGLFSRLRGALTLEG